MPTMTKEKWVRWAVDFAVFVAILSLVVYVD